MKLCKTNVRVILPPLSVHMFNHKIGIKDVWENEILIGSHTSHMRSHQLWLKWGYIGFDCTVGYLLSGRIQFNWQY